MSEEFLFFTFGTTSLSLSHFCLQWIKSFIPLLFMKFVSLFGPCKSKKMQSEKRRNIDVTDFHIGYFSLKLKA